MKSGKIDVPEDVIHTSALRFIKYEERISIVSLKGFMILTVLNTYVPECTVICFQTWDNLYK